MKARIQRLRAEIASDRQVFDEQVRELASLDLSREEPGDLARAAVALHHAYGSVEGALARLARTLDEGLPDGPDWHRALLHAMSLEVEGVRPAILTGSSVTLLQRLLAFRYFFRHAYSTSLDGARLASLCEDALSLRAALSADLDQLDAWLAELATSTD